jgi:hypothetical protein
MPAPRFTLTVPATWYALDLDARTRTDSIARLVEERLGPTPTPELRQLRRELTATLRQYARQAANNGAAYAALMYQVVDGIPLSASLLIAYTAAPRDPAGQPARTPADLGAALAPAPPPDPGAAPGGASPTEIRTLAGPAARLATEPDGTLHVQYALPVPESDLALTMTFATPNLAQAEPLGQLFDAIARTLEWTGG